MEDTYARGELKLTEQPFMKFEIREKVKHFKDNVSFQTLTTVEMHPIVNVYDSRDKVDISGHLVVSGEFNQATAQNNWEEQYEQSDGLHYGEMFSEQEQLETFQYQIPLSIQIQQDRITDVDQVFVLVDHFDYEVVSDEEIEVVAYVKVLGIHPDIKQESPVEYYAYDDESTDPEDKGYSQFTTLNKDEDEVVSYENESSEESSRESSQESSADYTNSNEDTQEVTQEVDLEEDDPKDNVIPFPVDAVAEPTDAPVVEEEENQPPKMKIGFKGKAREDKKEVTGENPLYSLLKKDKKANLEQEVQQVQEVEVQEEVQEVISKDNSLAEITDEMTENEIKYKTDEVDNQETQAQDTEEDVAEEVSSEVEAPKTKKMLFSLLKGNEEKRVKVKMVIVQKDDTLELIAEKYSVKEYDLIQYNRLESNQINDGQILYIPVKA